MENLTHSLVGAALAELAVPAGASTAQRHLFFAAGVIAANLPDADLFYTGVTASPLGSLLHHRGHTHTLVGLAAQALLIGAVCLIPAIRRHVGGSGSRLWGLIATALLSHIVLDSWNSYGVHPFFPFDNRWYYGDAIFIVEPWFWAFLGVAAVMNAENGRWKIALGVVFALATFAFVMIGMVPLTMMITVTVVAIGLAWLSKKWTPTRRSGVGLFAVVVYVAMMFGLKGTARNRVVESIQPALHGELMDVVLSPLAASPMCWTAIAIERDEGVGEYVMSRGVVSLVPRALGNRLCGTRGAAPAEWREQEHESLATLRALERSDCRVAAWLQFARAPLLSEKAVADFRYGDVSPGNFTYMALAAHGVRQSCPVHLPPWGKPRADLLSP
ncbi:MAG: metal-dependent hydrolase [bacterium]